MIIYQEAKQLLLQNKSQKDFLGYDYYMNVYRGCSHRCIYCSTRSDVYNVDNFDNDVIVKKNAPELLDFELSKKKKKGYIGMSGSMSDCYMHVEKDLKLTRRCLEVIKKHDFPVIIHTKSDLVLRDIDLLEDINKNNEVIVLMTITHVSDRISEQIEPNVSKSSDRFKALKKLSDRGITTGVAMCPIIPFITDNEENVRRMFKYASMAGCKYLIVDEVLTLIDSQAQYFYDRLKKIDENICHLYKSTFGTNSRCISTNITVLRRLIRELSVEYNISIKAPEYKNPLRQLTIFD